jgi:hypothetical protein
MARTLAALPAGTRITDYISLGVVTKAVPLITVKSVLRSAKKLSQRQRDLPAHVVVYYVVALALYMQSSYREVLRCLLEGLHWLRQPDEAMPVAGKSGISQARTRLGLGSAAATTRPGGQAGSERGHQGRLVSEVASGEFGWQYAGRGRRKR